jgi:hypothetical protein
MMLLESQLHVLKKAVYDFLMVEKKALEYPRHQLRKVLTPLNKNRILISDFEWCDQAHRSIDPLAISPIFQFS